MLTTEAIEKAIEMHEGGATESAAAKGTGISRDEAKAIAEAVYLGETERLFREVVLADVLAAAMVLRGGRGLIGDSAAEVVREIQLCYPGAGIKGSDADRNESSRTSSVDTPETRKGKSQ